MGSCSRWTGHEEMNSADNAYNSVIIQFLSQRFLSVMIVANHPSTARRLSIEIRGVRNPAATSQRQK
jgi:hypothetical protein